MPFSPPVPGHRRTSRFANLARVGALLALVVSLGACAGERPTLDAARQVPATSTPAVATGAPGGTDATSGTSGTDATGGTDATSGTSGTDAPGATGGTGGTDAAGVTTAEPTGPRVLGPDNLLGYIATPNGSPVVRATKDQRGEALEVPAQTTFGAPTTFAVIGDPTAPTDPWIEVLLPTRPNGSTGWVERSSVTVTKTPMRVFVDLTARSLRVENDGKEVLSTSTAIGTKQNPTPAGVSYVTELIDNDNPSGAYGPYAFGLALHSETLSEFGGGDGQVGIHGTNSPQLIGQAVSHGCVRMTNENVEKLVDLQLPLGVPVFIS